MQVFVERERIDPILIHCLRFAWFVFLASADQFTFDGMCFCLGIANILTGISNL